MLMSLFLRRLPAVVILGLALLGPAWALAAGPLDLVPQNATAVIRLRSPEATFGKAGEFANKVQPGMGFMVQNSMPGLGQVISNQTLGGVDLKQDWYAAVFAQKGTPPTVAFIIPASDVEQMKSAVGSDFTFAVKDSWVIYSQDEATVELMEDCVEGKAKAISATADERAAALLNGSDLALHVNVAELAKTYAEEIAGADQQIDGFLEIFAAQAATAPGGINIKPVIDMYGKAAHAIVQSARDSDSFTITLNVTASALTLDELLVAREGTPTEKFLSSQKVGPMELLTRLPQDQQGYFAVEGNFEGLMEFGMSFAQQMLGDNKDVKDRLDKAMAAMKDVKFQGMAGSFQLVSGTDGALRGVSVVGVSPAAKMREISHAMGNLNVLELPGLKQSMDLQKDAETYGDLKGDVMTLKQEFSEELDPLGMQNKLQAMLHGPNGMVQRTVVKGDYLVQTVGGSQDSMKAALGALDASPADGGALVKARARLFEKANFIGLIDLPNMGIRGLEMAAGSGALPLPIKPQQVENFKVPVSYLGFAVQTEPRGLRMRTEIPVETLNGFAQIVAFVQQAMQQQFQNNGDNN